VTTITPLDRIGVGIDTARYGHRVSFLRPDLQPAAKPLTVTENHAGYQALRDRLDELRLQHPQVHFHVRIDAAGQYAANLEQFLRGLDGPMTISIGEPKRNKDYRMVHFPKRATDDTESQAMARFALVERPAASPAPLPAMTVLRELAGRLQGQVKQTTRATNQLHNLLARTFPELATLADDIAAGWVLRLLKKYPTAERIAAARLSSLEKIPHLGSDQARALQQAAGQSVASLRGAVAESLVRNLVDQVVRNRRAERDLQQLVIDAWDDLPASPHVQVLTIPGIGQATAAILVAKIVDIDRFATPERLLNYFGVFPEEESSGTDEEGQPRPTGPMPMSRKGNDLVRAYLWNAARAAIRHNPAVRAQYRRLRARGKRGDVAIGHGMGKLLRLVFAVWKTNRPFDAGHYAWEPAGAQPATTAAGAPTAGTANKNAVGHKQDEPAGKVVTTAPSTVEPIASAVNPVVPSIRVARPRVDYAFLREQITMEQVLAHLGLLSQLRGRGEQRRGPCPLHSHAGATDRTFSVNLKKNMFQCFHGECRVQGNALDLWGAVHRLPLYEAALHLAETFGLARKRVSTAEAVLPANRRVSDSELTDHANDSESRARLLIFVDERANDHFQIDLFTQ
jgi:transposase